MGEPCLRHAELYLYALHYRLAEVWPQHTFLFCLWTKHTEEVSIQHQFGTDIKHCPGLARSHERPLLVMLAVFTAEYVGDHNSPYKTPGNIQRRTVLGSRRFLQPRPLAVVATVVWVPRWSQCYRSQDYGPARPPRPPSSHPAPARSCVSSSSTSASSCFTAPAYWRITATLCS